MPIIFYISRYQLATMLIHLFVLLFAGTQIIIAQDVAPTPTLGRWDLEGTFPIANGTRLDCEEYVAFTHEYPRTYINFCLLVLQLLVD